MVSNALTYTNTPAVSGVSAGIAVLIIGPSERPPISPDTPDTPTDFDDLEEQTK
jgi:hypothetical protein